MGSCFIEGFVALSSRFKVCNIAHKYTLQRMHISHLVHLVLINCTHKVLSL